jgi:2-keto-4-pentenoate hydratase/2-oxohepta-3-ene-1,7-dioic acid hydratase in catechol pathway
VRLVTYSRPGSSSRLGAEASIGTIHDLTAALGVDDVGEMVARGITARDAENLLPGAAAFATDEVALQAPVRRPGKIICVGLNYHDHCREQGADPPAYPMLFSKFANAVAHPGQPITRPAATEQLDLECELAVVIGRRASRIGPSEASEVILGYTILNDVTMRDLQREDRQWLRAKGSDGFAPMGPAVVTADELGDLRALGVRSSVNGETWQDSTTGEMIFDVPTLVAFASRTITLEPGDIIATGTPAGVGHFAEPPRYLADGDVMRCEIAGIGAIENRVVDELPRLSDHAEAAGIGSLAAPTR